MVRKGLRRIGVAAACALASVAADGDVPAGAWPLQPATSSGSLVVRKIAVFGGDDRVPVPAKYRSVQDKIGLLFNVRGRTVCTAFCVSKDVIATAGHCLHKVAGERPPRVADFWFARTYASVRDFVRVAGHAVGTAAQHVRSGAMSLNGRPPIDASKDWALVRLSRPACMRGVLPVRALPTDEIVREARANRVFQIA